MMKRWIITGVIFSLVLVLQFAKWSALRSLTSTKDQFATSVLITGGCGFVGRHFTKKFCDLGYHITIVDNLMSQSALPLDQWPEHLKCENVEFYQMDCREYFQTHGEKEYFDLFIHLAAVVGGRATIENAPITVADDLSIDAAAFQWAISPLKEQPGKMVYFSSSAAYPVRLQGAQSYVLLDESLIDLVDPSIDIAKPDLTYGWAKLTGEYLALLAHKTAGLNVVVYRPMSGYGEDQHETYPFKAILQRALKKENPIRVWSNAVRDFIHIDDVVRCVLDTMNTVQNGEPINLATGVATSMVDIARIAAEYMGYKASIEIEQNKPKGVNYRVGSAAKLKSHGCVPKISIEEGVSMALTFMKNKKS